uniref:Uncharacterized protein n=1 Tax=Anguilla anguilla TaxID=7936 RepID=A0A0E9PPX3_ANGAN
MTGPPTARTEAALFGPPLPPLHTHRCVCKL